MRPAIHALWTCSLAIVASACSRKSEEAPPPPVPNDAQASGFAKAFSEALVTSDLATLRKRFIDEKAVMDSLVPGFIFSERAMKSSQQAFIQLSQEYLDLFKNLSRERSLSFVKSREVGGERRLVYRQLGDKGYLSYYEFVLTLRMGRVGISDIIIYRLGDRLSGMLRELHAMALTEIEGFTPKSLPADLRDLIAHHDEAGRMTDAFRGGRMSEGMAASTILPASVRNLKSNLYLRLRCARQNGRTHVDAALEELERLYPDDIGVIAELIMDPRSTSTPGRILELANRLERAVGGDPYVHVIRSMAHKLDGHHEEAKRALRTAIEEDPSLRDAYLYLLNYALEEKNVKQAVSLLEILESKFEWKIPVESRSSELKAIYQSPEYKERRKSPP